MPIRQGDGTPLAPNGFTEVRLGDGTVIWVSETYIESFEGGIAGYTGDTTAFTTTTGVTGTPHGSTVLEMTGTGYNAIYHTGGGLPNGYPTPGNVYKIWFYDTGSNAQYGFRFGVQDANNCYESRYEANQDDHVLIRWDAGASTILSSNNTVSTAYPGGAWWYYLIDWGATTSGTITVGLYDATDALIDERSVTNETTYTTGGIGFRPYQGATTGGGIYYDAVEENP